MSTTTTVLRRVLARLEAERADLAERSLLRAKGKSRHSAEYAEFAKDISRLNLLRLLQGDDQLLADLAEHLDAESR